MLVQSRAQTVASATSASLAYTSNVTAGNLLFAFVGAGPGGATGTRSVSDTQGNSWTFIGGAGGLDGVSNINLYFAVAKTTGANTFQWSLSAGAAGSMDTIIGEVNGLTATPLDQHNAVGQSANPGNITTTQAAEYIIAGCIGVFNAAGTWSATNSFAIEQSVTEGIGTAGMAFADRTVSSIGTYTTTFSNTGGSFGGDAAVIASFFIGSAPAPLVQLKITLRGVKRRPAAAKPVLEQLPPEKHVTLFPEKK